MAIKIYKVQRNGMEFTQQFEESTAEDLGLVEDPGLVEESVVEDLGLVEDAASEDTKSVTPKNKAATVKNK